MKKTLCAMTASFMLSGCLTPDDLVSKPQAQARQEIRLEQYRHLSCSELHRAYIANKPNALTPLVVTGVLAYEADRDIKEMLRRKGCRLPEGKTS